MTSANAPSPRLVREVVCGFAGELPTAWLAVFHRFERQIKRSGLRIRVRLAPLDALPDRVDVLVVPPELAKATRELAPGAVVIVTTRGEAAASVDALLADMRARRSLYAEPVRPGESRIVIQRGTEEL